ncbi:MAG: transcriptional regulator PpsR [Burkholderiaceae bacterium]|nr:transcriptional regulator PpsR [Burkholderiaceae bacterium]
MIEFSAPRRFLAGIDPQTAARLISTAADVALVIDRSGVIRDVSVGHQELLDEGYERWRGLRWAETVTAETRPKVEEMLESAVARGEASWRQVNHPSRRGDDVPMLYSAVKVGKRGPVIALGRNLRSISALQQQLVQAQQSLERDFQRLRQAEARYRLLFQLATDAIVIVDAATLKVVEANPAASRLLGNGARSVVGRPLADGLGPRAVQSLQALFDAARSAGRADEIRLRIGDGRDPREYRVSASLFRQENATYFLVRLTPAAGAAEAPAAVASATLRALEGLPDGFVVTDLEGRVLWVNRAFLDLVQAPSVEQVRGKSLENWLGRERVDLNVLIANMRQHGSVRLFATTVRDELGERTEVEISAVAVAEAETPCLGFSFRPVGRRLAPPAGRERGQLPRSLEQLTELIGRVPLKDIVRETADVIERMCIEAALRLTGDNRASAAEMLGLSRQSLYVKMHRYGLGDLGREEAS